MEWMILPLKRYAQFGGRSRRMEFWMWILFIVLVNIVLSILDATLGLGGRAAAGAGALPGGFGYGAGISGGVLANIFTLAVLIPNIAVAVRRLHDIDRSGWWILLPLLPYVIGIAAILSGAAAGSIPAMVVGGVALLSGLVCAIVILVWYCTAGTVGPNRYGDDPKADIPADLARTFE